MPEYEGEPPKLDENRPLNPRTTLVKAIAVLILLAIAICGMAYAGHDIWTNFGKR